MAGQSRHGPHSREFPEGGDVLVRRCESGVEIIGDPAGLRDLARWCLVLVDDQVPDGTPCTPGKSGLAEQPQPPGAEPIPDPRERSGSC